MLLPFKSECKMSRECRYDMAPVISTAVRKMLIMLGEPACSPFFCRNAPLSIASCRDAHTVSSNRANPPPAGVARACYDLLK